LEGSTDEQAWTRPFDNWRVASLLAARRQPAWLTSCTYLSIGEHSPVRESEEIPASRRSDPAIAGPHVVVLVAR
jgi:hypothetical protein